MSRPAGEHRCHAHNCDVEVPPRMFMCKRHWVMLPRPTRHAIWLHYNQGQEKGDAEVTEEYLRVTRNAIQYIAKKEAPKQGDLF